MALEGHGIAFLPQSAVREELRTRRLVSAVGPDSGPLAATMEIRAYRERAAAPSRAGAESPRRNTRGAAAALWSYLLQNGLDRGSGTGSERSQA